MKRVRALGWALLVVTLAFVAPFIIMIGGAILSFGIPVGLAYLIIRLFQEEPQNEDEPEERPPRT